jgi:hypothetical protein
MTAAHPDFWFTSNPLRDHDGDEETTKRYTAAKDLLVERANELPATKVRP